MDKLTSDPDILAENAGKGGGESGREGNDLVWELEDDVELNVVGNTHEANSKTVVLLAQAGGLEKVRWGVAGRGEWRGDTRRRRGAK